MFPGSGCFVLSTILFTYRASLATLACMSAFSVQTSHSEGHENEFVVPKFGNRTKRKNCKYLFNLIFFSSQKYKFHNDAANFIHASMFFSFVSTEFAYKL